MPHRTAPDDPEVTVGRGRAPTTERLPLFDSVSRARLTDPPPDLLPSANRAERDRVLGALEAHRRAVVEALRAEARRCWQRTRQPVSANDVRHVLAALDYHGDPRVLGAVFRAPDWEPVAWTQTNSTVAHARPIRRFVYVGATP